MITVKIGDQEFVKTSDKWIDKKTKKPAPEGLIKILELAAAQMKNEEPKSDESPKSAGSSTSFKRETIEVKVLNKISLQLDRLGKSIEKLSAVILKNNEDSPAAPATKPPPVPSLMKAMGQTLKEKISGVKDQYGRVLTGGFLREAAGAISPNLASLYFGARDKQREAKAQLAEYEENQANLSTSAPKTGEQEEVETSIAKPSKYAAKEAVTENKETVKVELVEISNDVLEKLVRAIKTSSSSNDPLDKDDNTTSSDKKNPLGGIASAVAGGVGALAAGKKALGKVAASGLSKLKSIFVKEAGPNIVKNSAGRSIDAATGRFVTKEVAQAAEKKAAGGVLGKLGGAIASKAAIKTGVRGIPVIGKLGGAIASKAAIKTGIRGIPVLGGIIGGGLAAKETYDKTHNVAKSAASGAGALIGGIGGEVAGGVAGTFVAPGVGTAVGAVSGGIGGSLAGQKAGEKLYERIFEYKPEKITPKKPETVNQVKQSGPSVAAQNLKQASKENKRMQFESDKKSSPPQLTQISAPSSVVNSVQNSINMPTVGPRGSLDLATFT